MKMAAIFFIPLIMSVGINAGTTDEGILYDLHFMNNGVVLAYTTGIRNTVPSCASGQTKRFALDATTESGKVQFSGLLAAYAAKKKVRIVGTESCNVYSNTETINYFHTAD